MLRESDGSVRRAVARPALRRSLWVVVDQGLNSLTNFAVTVAVARWLDAEAFGAFGVVFVVYLVCLGLSRALVSQPLAIRASARLDARPEVAAAVGAVVAVGLVLALVVLGAGVAIGGEVGRLLPVLALFLPGLLLQDTWRWVFFTMAEPRRAVVNDLAWTLAQVAVMAAVLAMTRPTAVTMTGAWGVAALLAAGFGAHQARVWPEGVLSWAFLRRHRDLGGRLGAEFLLESGSVQLTTVGLALVVGPAGIGAIRGAQTLFGPFTTIQQGLAAAMVPEGSRLLARRSPRLRSLLYASSGALASAAVGWTVALVWLPGTWGTRLLGDTWPAARSLATPLAATMVGLGFASGAMVGLRVLAAASASLRLRLITGPVSLAVGVAGGTIGGVRGGAWGLAAGAWITGLGAWWAVGSQLQSYGCVAWRRAPTPASPEEEVVDGS